MVLLLYVFSCVSDCFIGVVLYGRSPFDLGVYQHDASFRFAVVFCLARLFCVQWAIGRGRTDVDCHEVILICFLPAVNNIILLLITGTVVLPSSRCQLNESARHDHVRACLIVFLGASMQIVCGCVRSSSVMYVFYNRSSEV